MGETAEVLAREFNISREEQDRYALCSQQRAERAIHGGRFDAEIVPVNIESKKGTQIFTRDEHPLPQASLEKMAKLKPVFSADGTITAGSSSGITDGAAAVVLGSEAFVKKHNLNPLAKILAATTAGVEPQRMGIGPVPALKKLQEKHGIKMADADLIELNEAFAAQVLACDRELHFDHDRLNVNGGSIALGHPIGCTGARITVTLLHEMLKRKVRLGIATLCVSGGLGIAMAIENVATH
jgi:acetyl-CoA C-acetyltransferase